MRRLGLPLLGLVLLLGRQRQRDLGPARPGHHGRRRRRPTWARTSEAQKERRAYAPASELANVPGPARRRPLVRGAAALPVPARRGHRPGRSRRPRPRPDRARRRPRPAVAAAWQALGPANIGGRVTDLVVDPVRADTVYAGAATGGVWRSTNAGAHVHQRVAGRR